MPPHPAPQAGGCLHEEFLLVFILGGSWDGSNSRGWGGLTAGARAALFKGAGCCPPPFAPCARLPSKKTTQMEQQQQQGIRRNTQSHQHQTDGFGMLC